MSPVAKARQCQAHSPAQGFGHGLERAVRIAAPVYGESLATGCGGASEESCFVRTKVPLQDFEGDLVVEKGVVIVHLLGTGTVIVYDVAGRDALAKVRLSV